MAHRCATGPSIIFRGCARAGAAMRSIEKLLATPAQIGGRDIAPVKNYPDKLRRIYCLGKNMPLLRLPAIVSFLRNCLGRVPNPRTESVPEGTPPFPPKRS